MGGTAGAVELEQGDPIENDGENTERTIGFGRPVVGYFTSGVKPHGSLSSKRVETPIGLLPIPHGSTFQAGSMTTNNHNSLPNKELQE